MVLAAPVRHVHWRRSICWLLCGASTLHTGLVLATGSSSTGSNQMWPPASKSERRANGQSVNVTVLANTTLATTSSHFTCWNIDASANRGFFWRDLNVSKPYGKQLARQAAAITGHRTQNHSLLRFGGSGNDGLVYEFGATKCGCPPGEQCTGMHNCLNQTTWQNLLGFAKAANAKVIFGMCEPKWIPLNDPTKCGNPDQGPHCGIDKKHPCTACPPWDPTNAREILQWTIAQGLDDVIYGLELGNEVDGLYTGAQQAQNLQILYNLTLELWADRPSRRPVLLGPDAAHQAHTSTPPWSSRRDAYVFEFFEAAGKLNLPIAGATLHKYIEVTTDRDTNPAILDETTQRFQLFKDTVDSGWAASGNKEQPAPRSWGGEIGPHNGGSPPCDHTSMRWAKFADSLWYVDAMASSAKLGFETFCRQDYIGADYGLVDCSTGSPLPDYWAIVLWTWLTGPTVLSAAASTNTGPDNTLRAYAHCTPHDAFDEPSVGQATLIAINLANETVEISLQTGGSKHTMPVTIMQLEPSAVAGLDARTGLNGTGAMLNSRPLHLKPNGDLPDLAQFAQRGISSAVKLAPQSVTFVVYSNPYCNI